MGFRFRKSFNAGPLRLNISKSGIGSSFGVPGFRHTFLANGRTRKTWSIPGTGLSYVEESSNRSRNRRYNSQTMNNAIRTVTIIEIQTILTGLFFGTVEDMESIDYTSIYNLLSQLIVSSYLTYMCQEIMVKRQKLMS